MKYPVLLAIVAWLVPHARPAAAGLAQDYQAMVEADWSARDRLLAAPAAASAPADKVTTAQDAAGGCDGVKTGAWGFHTASGETDPWWQVDLGSVQKLDRVVIFNRTDRNSAPRMRHIQVLAAEDAKSDFKVIYKHNGDIFYGVKENKPLAVDLKGKDVSARIVRLQVLGKCSFALDEVEVYAAADPAKNIALNQPADQKSVGQYSTVKTAGSKQQLASTSDFSPAHIRQVLDRARQLADRLRSSAKADRLQPLIADLAKLETRLSELPTDAPAETRRALYVDARRTLRQIAFTNPLLDIDKLLFITRHDGKGVYHMCDQYYGFNAVAGGGLMVLADPFGDNPKLTNLLENAVVEKGRLRGQRLIGGSFLSPNLSYDGRTIVFAWSQARGSDLQWSEQASYHIFKCNADGKGLVQLTDGPWNDFDPCFLPNGRIVFISERRGGYLRCGRHCPVYTMYGMAADGSDIICLSYHETHEWHPSINNEGMIVFTRWDYIDRDTNVAHHIWTCYPDGRDARTFHGNYPEKRESRPWMEMHIRAIPSSPKYVATAAGHHGHAFGSLVLIDPRLDDDKAMSQLVRLTPECPFPEAEKTKPIKDCQQYATAWPLSEDDYLCVYDPAAKNHGIYWIDRFGNKELIYRGAVPCQSPMPLRARARPPVIPAQTTQAADELAKAGGAHPTATISVMNVYDSDFAWPAEMKVAALRIIQVLPKTTAPPNEPRIGVADQTNARAVLGTVPVEADGSAFFEAPVGKEIYFQAIDERGMAIQSMRSGTYVHAGERLTCQGCHETKHRSPKPLATPPMALRRAPSKIQPEMDGASPFNYVRLVQPVLDRNCVACHQQKKALDLSGVIEGKHGWTRSYTNLAAKYGFFFESSNGSINRPLHGGARTTPGQFGARASKLLAYLNEKHYGVKLSAEDVRRIALWLDCNSEFYGSYENTPAQAQGQIVKPLLD